MRGLLLVLLLAGAPARAHDAVPGEPASTVLVDPDLRPALPDGPGRRLLLRLLDVEARLQDPEAPGRLTRRWRRQLARALDRVDDTSWRVALETRRDRDEGRETAHPQGSPPPDLATLERGRALLRDGHLDEALAALAPLARDRGLLAPDARGVAAVACRELADLRGEPPVETCIDQPRGVLRALVELLATDDRVDEAVDTLDHLRAVAPARERPALQARAVQLLRQAPWPDPERLAFEERALAELGDPPAPAGRLPPSPAGASLLSSHTEALTACRDVAYPLRPVGRVDLVLDVADGHARPVDVRGPGLPPQLVDCVARTLDGTPVPSTAQRHGPTPVSVVFLVSTQGEPAGVR